MDKQNESPLYVVIKTPSGGAWTTAKKTAEYWSSLGYDIRIVSFLNDPLPDIEGIKTHALMHHVTKGKKYNRPFTVLLCLFLMLKWIVMEKPRHIMGVGLPITMPLFLLSRLLFWRRISLSLVLETHISAHLKHKKAQVNSLTFRIMALITHNKMLYRWMMTYVVQAICLSSAMADDMVAHYGLDKGKIHIIPPFIDEKFFDHPLPKEAPDNIILYVGRLSPEKNIGDVLKAMQILLRSKPDVMLKIVGDGECREELEKQSANLSLGSAVEFCGVRYNIPEYHAAAACQILTSHYEGFPLVLVEACASGVPLVSYDGPSGPRDAIEQDVNGFVVPQYDVKALVCAIEKALDKQWDRQKIRETAQKFKTKSVQEKCKKFIEDYLNHENIE